jgi:hypothetical protein
LGPVDELILANEDPSSATPDHVANQTALGSSLDTIDPNTLFWSFINPSVTLDMDCGIVNDAPVSRSQLETEIALSGLQTTVERLQSDLQRHATQQMHLQRISSLISWPTCFSVANVRKCIKEFFGREQLLATVIHRSHFRAEQMHLALVLAIIVAGSTYQHLQTQDRSSLAGLLGLRAVAESYIFVHVETLLATLEPCTDSQRDLEVCQAAYIVVTLQSCIKDTVIRQRVICDLHPKLVRLLRKLKLLGQPQNPRIEEESWIRFIYEESCTRLIHWVFINDAWFSLLSNSPPVMTINDMIKHLPCDDQLWHADEAVSYERLRLTMMRTSRPVCVKDIMVSLLGDESTAGNFGSCRFLDINIKHFLPIILGKLSSSLETSALPIEHVADGPAFQHVIFHHQTSVLVGSSTCVLLRAVDRWSEMWNYAVERLDQSEKLSLSLVKHSTELALLFRRILETSISDQGNNTVYLRRHVMYDTLDLYRFIQGYVSG